MKALIISDSHGNIKNLKHVVGFGKKIGVGAVIHCGDWNTLHSIEVVIDSKIPFYSVLGNADIDPGVGELLKSKGSFDPEILFFVLNGKKIAISHYVSRLKKEIENIDIGFYGHRHTPEKSMFKGKKLVRPGALEKNINFVVYDTNTDKIEFINEEF